MYTVSEAYQNIINSDSPRTWDLRITIETAAEVIEFTGDYVLKDSLKLESRLTDSDNFDIGGAIPLDFGVTIFNIDGEFDDVHLSGARIYPEVGLEVSDGGFEWIPLGVFNIDTVTRTQKTPDVPMSFIIIEAVDNFIKCDVPLSRAAINYPISAGNMLTLICQHCGINLDTSNFPNKDFLIKEAPHDDYTCWSAIYNIAQIAGSYAIMNRSGRLELRSYKNPGFVQEAIIDGNDDSIIIDGGSFSSSFDKLYDGGVFAPETPDLILGEQNRFDFRMEDGVIKVTGIQLVKDEETYLVGSDKYAIMIIDNPLIQHDYEGILNSIYSRFINFTYLPCETIRKEDPSIDIGDLVVHTDVNGQSYRTIVTYYEYKYQGQCTIESVGKTEAGLARVPSETRRNIKVRRKIHDKQVQIDAMQEAVKTSFALLSGIWGGYVINGDDLGGDHAGRIYLSDNTDIAQAQKIWMWSLGGIGYFESGIANEPKTAWTQDGAIVASLVTAEMIRTGLLQSAERVDGKPVSWLDLDNGNFSFGNGALKWDKDNGFEAISAKEIRSIQGDSSFAKIGKIFSFDEELIPAIQLRQGNTVLATLSKQGILNGDWNNATSGVMLFDDVASLFSGNSSVFIDGGDIGFTKNGAPYGFDGVKWIDGKVCDISSGIILD